jgi:hypothetical protein
MTLQIEHLPETRMLITNIPKSLYPLSVTANPQGNHYFDL